MTFAEAMDLCLRTSLPLLLLALIFLAISLAIAPSASSRPTLFRWSGNGTEAAIDYTKNDLLLGSQDPTFWFLVPLSGLLSAGICVLVNYAALGLTYFLSLLYYAILPNLPWTRADEGRFVDLLLLWKIDELIADRRATVPALTANSPRRRLITTSALLLMVSTFIPYQFAYLVACLVQLATCTRASRLARETVSSPSPASEIYTGINIHS